MNAVAWLVIGLVGWAGSVQAACMSYDTTAWTQSQRNHLSSIAYRLLFEAGENVVPTQTVEGMVSQLCFEGSSSDLNAILAETAILARMQQEAETQAANLAVELLRVQSLEDERRINPLCNAELDALTSRIDQTIANLQGQLDATSTVAQVKTHLRDQVYPALGTAFKQVARCLRAKVD